MVRVEGLQRITSQTELISSKGNQNKWYADGKWYKEDGLGYEVLAEVLISRLLKKTNVRQAIVYEYEALYRENRIVHGCVSDHFMKPEDDKVISVECFKQTRCDSGKERDTDFEMEKIHSGSSPCSGCGSRHWFCSI